jgi:hypothetical protein
MEGGPMAMVGKQVYLEPEQDRKLKAIASQRRCTEAEVIRDAVNRLALDEDPFVAALRARGLPMDVEGPEVSDDEIQRMERKWAETAKRIGNVNLSGAIAEDRAERDAFLAGHIGPGETHSSMTRP